MLKTHKNSYLWHSCLYCVITFFREVSTLIPFPISALPISADRTYYLRLFHNYSTYNSEMFYWEQVNVWLFSSNEPRPSAGLVKVTPISENHPRSLYKFEFLHSQYCANFELLKYAYQTDAFIMKGTGSNGKFFSVDKIEGFPELESHDSKHSHARQFVLEPRLVIFELSSCSDAQGSVRIFLQAGHGISTWTRAFEYFPF